LSGTTRAVTEAWLVGDVSATYSATAFEQTLELLDAQRATLNASPELLVNPLGASLSRRSEQLARLVASLAVDAKTGDTDAARHQLAELPPLGR
jgi:hypothetical protein